MAFRKAKGIWRSRRDVLSFYGALYVLMTRTTGLIEKPGSLGQGKLLQRHMIHPVN